MNILMVSRTPTHPTTAGNRWGILAMSNALQQLGAEIYFLYIDERGLKSGHMNEAQRNFDETKAYWKNRFFVYRVTILQKTFRNVLKRVREKLTGYHQGLYDEYPWRLHRKINELDRQYHFDACIVNYIFLTKTFRYIDIAKRACFTHDVFAYKNLVVGEKCMWMDAAQEARALQLCTDIFAVQDIEMHYFQVLAPQSRFYNIYSKYEYQPQTVVGNKNIVFLSGDNIYNKNGLMWFLQSVFPLIRQRYPDAKLLIGGSICKVIKWNCEGMEGVEFHGYVENLYDFYNQGDVAINPTYQGTGLKIKTFEAIANDKVTMVHPHSMKGVFKKEEVPLFASDKPDDWVAYLDEIWSNPNEIFKIKKRNKEYLAKMNEFIESEYKRFLGIC